MGSFMKITALFALLGIALLVSACDGGRHGCVHSDDTSCYRVGGTRTI
jgi:hypothetical protein